METLSGCCQIGKMAERLQAVASEALEKALIDMGGWIRTACVASENVCCIVKGDIISQGSHRLILLR